MLPDFEYRVTDTQGYHLRRFATASRARAYVHTHPGSHLVSVHQQHPWKTRLRCESNTPAMQRQIMHAWRQTPAMRGAVQAHFEHGQWWIVHIVTGAAWSVNDCVAPDGQNDFSFEQL